MLNARLPAFILLAAFITAADGDEPPTADAALGERLYLHGTLESGEPLHATAQGDISFSGAQFSCVNCHRRSGYGSSEGGKYVLPITGPILYAPRDLNRADLFKKLFKETQPREFQARIRQAHMRPGYTDATLAVAITAGSDPTGRKLDPLMPRYDLDERNMANLLAYLKTLSVQSDPGVDDKNIYFATIVTANADPAKREAMRSTQRAFVQWRNLHTAGDTRNPSFSPNYRSEFIHAYRNWRLDEWVLRGPPDSWPEQLQQYYQQRPVFAVISGLVDGPWQPVHEFCEDEKVPCLFPHTALPPIDQNDLYSVYFSRGLRLEADVVARYLLVGGQLNTTDSNAELESKEVLQLFADTPEGTSPAVVLRAALTENPQWRLQETRFDDRKSLKQKLKAIERRGKPLDALIIWPGVEAGVALAWLNKHPQVARLIMLPSTAMPAAPKKVTPELAERLCFSYPFEVPEAYHPRAFRVRAWLGTRGLKITDKKIQYDTYYALTVVQYALESIVGRFSRDYFLEFIEHEAENELNPGTYPRLSLGPGQRFASKGAYIVRLDKQAKEGFVAESDWIVP